MKCILIWVPIAKNTIFKPYCKESALNYNIEQSRIIDMLQKLDRYWIIMYF